MATDQERIEASELGAYRSGSGPPTVEGSARPVGSVADALQGDFNDSISIAGHLSNLVSHNPSDVVDPVTVSDAQVTQDLNGSDTVHVQSEATSSGFVKVQNLGSAPQLVGRSLSPSLMGEMMHDANNIIASNGFGGVSWGMAGCHGMENVFSSLNLSNNREDHEQGLLHHEFAYWHESSFNMSTGNCQHLQTGSIGQYPNANLASIDLTELYCKAYSANCGLPATFGSELDSGGAYTRRNGSQIGFQFIAPVMDPLVAQHLLRGADSAALTGDTLSDISLSGSYLGGSGIDLPDYQSAYLGALLAQQKLQHDKAFLRSTGGFSHGFDGNPSFGLGMLTSPGSVLVSLSPGSLPRQSDCLSYFPCTIQSSNGGLMGSWNHEHGLIQDNVASSMLKELKSNKKRTCELSEIVDHVIEFSVDRYGSHLIRQKLETASLEDKKKIFPKILPHALVLSNNVFGNYVIQSFFEHGTEDQRKQLASQLLGHVLPLSLQMYGSRVIQKALEVVDVDQQTQMVLELDGAVIKCVHDHHGNYVIQTCIECVPQDRIQFIISAINGQVAALSTHPCGCRVIQRVLEHSDDVDTQKIMMDEIMQSVHALAQDQYGNYVIQHVLQHGKKEERSTVISKLSGQIVKMSLHKFASNVVEKCLMFGTPEERQLLIDEMLGSTDENKPLQAMMKHQFGNFVVQKVLETCDDHNRELILSQITVHLDTLKTSTYGKHIVACVEKFIATKERCRGISLCT